MSNFQPIPEDDPELHALLAAEQLPTEDLAGTQKKYYGLKDAPDGLIAAGGLEICGSNAIIRSCVVAPSRKGHRLGVKLIDYLVTAAKQNQIKSLYLLTETAPGFFEKLGFKTIGRDDVPTGVAQSTQFSEICPQSAIAMTLDLSASPEQDSSPPD